MRLNVGVLSAAVVLTCAPFSIAGPLFPCPTAVNSVHGNAIAIAHNTTEWHTGSGKLLSVQFTVMTKTNFVNDSQKISAPVIYWGDWPWAVVLDMNSQADRSFSSCAVPLVTDDAQFLILLATGPAFNSALRVYRKGDSSDRMQDGTVKLERHELEPIAVAPKRRIFSRRALSKLSSNLLMPISRMAALTIIGLLSSLNDAQVCVGLKNCPTSCARISRSRFMSSTIAPQVL